MSISTYLDNSFFHPFQSWSKEDKFLIQAAFSSRRYSLYVSGELLIEMAGVAGTRKEIFLLERAQFLVGIMGSMRILEYGGKLVKRELLGQSSGTPFLTADQSERFKSILRGMSEGRIPEHVRLLLDEIRQKKQEEGAQFEDIKELLQSAALTQHGRISSKDCGFEQFYQGNISILEEILKRPYQDGSVSSYTIQNLIFKPDLFPHTHKLFRGLMALTYVNSYENRGVKHSDPFDVQQLAYLVNMDLLVSGDAKMKRVCELAYGLQPRVLAPDEFLSEVKDPSKLAVCPSTSSGRTA